MNAGVAVVGLLIILLGGVVTVGAFSGLQSVVNPVSLSSLQLPACTYEGGTAGLYSCNYQVTLTNNAESSTPLTIWWNVCNPVTGSCIEVVTQTVNPAIGGTYFYSTGAYPACQSTPICLMNIPVGTYTLALFTTDEHGVSDSNTLTSTMCVPGPCSATTATTSFSNTVSGTFTIYYPAGVALGSVTPPGSGPSTLCSNGMSCYTATWTPGTQVSMTATFNPALWNLCWIYDTGTASNCDSNPITSGVAFTITSELSPHYAILLSSANPTPSVTITPVADLAGGSWNKGAFTLTPTSMSSGNLVYTSPSGSTCSNFWYLQPIPANPSTQPYWLTGSSAQQGFSITYAQVQPLVSTQGTTFQLIDGTPDQTLDPCIQITYALTYTPTTGVACTFGVGTGTPCATEQVLSGQKVTLSATITPGYAFGGWLVDGVNQGATNFDVTVTMSSAHAVQATATYVGGGGTCTASGTDASLQVFVKDSRNDSVIIGATVSFSGTVATTDSTGSVCIQGIHVGNLLNGYTGTGTVTVHKVGFADQTVKVSLTGGAVTQVAVFLNPSTTTLSSTYLGLAIIAVGLVVTLLGVAMRGKS